MVGESFQQKTKGKEKVMCNDLSDLANQIYIVMQKIKPSILAKLGESEAERIALFKRVEHGPLSESDIAKFDEAVKIFNEAISPLLPDSFSD